MNKKAQIAGIGVLITVAIAVIVGAILLQASAPSVANVNTLQTITNQTFTLPAQNATATLGSGQATSNVVVQNRTSGAIVVASEYTITNYVLSNGVLVSRLTLNGANYSTNVVNVSYTQEPFGYATDSGSRAVIGLVLVFAALAILVVVVTPVGAAVRDMF